MVEAALIKSPIYTEARHIIARRSVSGQVTEIKRGFIRKPQSNSGIDQPDTRALPEEILFERIGGNK